MTAEGDAIKTKRAKAGRKKFSAGKLLTPEQNRKKFADYKFSWHVLLSLKRAWLDFPEMDLQKPVQVFGDNGLPELVQIPKPKSKPMSERARLAREFAIVCQINPKPAVDDWLRSVVDLRLGLANGVLGGRTATA